MLQLFGGGDFADYVQLVIIQTVGVLNHIDNGFDAAGYSHVGVGYVVVCQGGEFIVFYCYGNVLWQFVDSDYKASAAQRCDLDIAIVGGG